MFDIVSKTVHIAARKNLEQVSKVLEQIVGGNQFEEDNPSYVPINDFVRKAIVQMSAWLFERTSCNPDARRKVYNVSIVAEVPDAETQFHAHEFLDVTVQPKPIYISPNEVYTMHGLLSQHQQYLV
jgi:Ras GTPase-activating-like protein IQGAP2/3